ncbi:hypothetical protein J2T55_002560 [Methylohalomonas lacus]|uniref:Nucleotidyltransferase-like domain-containing protein n=1 Tax=Methylohalomonas lacus TaxID=398773 RepID=A0AAE3HLH2_9GAMM|nr:GSU2403 family nucleotidyltransferase fold protein [Methylohalomonas lacus]MCS3904521.1 hypothetical protein [Methylohalomonas lacus]
MQPKPQSLTARTLFAELRELALAVGALENIGDTPGSVVDKNIKGRAYLYYQYRDLDGRTRQCYLGPDDAATRSLVERLRQRAQLHAADRERLDELRGAFLAAGGLATASAPLRVLKAFADAGVLQPGRQQGVLVGTHAFIAMGNLLGVNWSGNMQTQDIDLAGSVKVDIAVQPAGVDTADLLDKLNMGFIPVPSLNPKSPSTAFRVRGQELRVDLLTPMTGKQPRQPVFVPAFNAPAQPVRFLDYLIEETLPTVLAGHKYCVLLNIPSPERFALHKLLVSESRSSTFAAKAEKDRLQSAQLLQVLVSEAPDGLKQARDDLVGRGKQWAGKLQRGLEKIETIAPEASRYVAAL